MRKQITLFLFIILLGIISMNGFANGSFIAEFGASIAFQETGASNRPSVILIHGFPASHQMWKAQVDALKSNFHVITYDLRGLGQSTIKDGQYTLEIFVDDFFALLKHLNIEKAHVVGFSMGGYIALRAIEKNPDRFLSLSLIDTQSLSDSDEGKLKRTQALRTIKTEGLEKFAQGFAQGALSKKTHTENLDLVKHFLHMITNNSEAGVSGGLLALISRTDTSKSLSTIKVPTLIIVGENDTLTPVKQSEAMKEAIPHSKLKILEGCGHFSPMENPEEFNSLLLDFLKILHP